MGIENKAVTIAQYNIQAVLLPADDRFTPGEPFHVGNATHGGVRDGDLCYVAEKLADLHCQFDARPSGQIHCGNFDERIQLYCDSPDKYCSNGTSLAVHNGYHAAYGQQALDFVRRKLDN